MNIANAARLTTDEFAGALDLRQALDKTQDPDIAPTTDEEFRLLLTLDETENSEHDRVAAFEDGQPIALGHLERTRDVANPTFAVLMIDAHNADIPHTRPVLARLLDLAEADGRTSILSWGDLNDARDEFWTTVGASRRQVDRDSDLYLDDVDPDLMSRWVEARRERASSVELVAWSGLPPDEHLDAFVATRNAMNDAPRDDIEVSDFVATVDATKAEAQAWMTLGWSLHGLLAIEEDGSAVGMSNVMVNSHRPDASWQGDTVVLNQHRQRGVGRWLKAAMYFHLRESIPEVTRLRTGNAESNDPMLAINVAMGYRPAHASAGWQADISTLRAGLAT